MRKIQWPFLIIILLFSGCLIQSRLPSGIPRWLKQKISTLEAQPVQNPPAAVYEYEYLGETVYYFPPRCCDIFSELYDHKGNLICHPDGGITGMGDGQCPEFFLKARLIRLVWQDPRE